MASFGLIASNMAENVPKLPAKRSAMNRPEVYRIRATELLSQAKKLSEHAQRYLRLADQAEREAAQLDGSARELEEFDFLSFLTAPPMKADTRSRRRATQPSGSS